VEVCAITTGVARTRRLAAMKKCFTKNFPFRNGELTHGLPPLCRAAGHL
jgi:hypothetical protein